MPRHEGLKAAVRAYEQVGRSADDPARGLAEALARSGGPALEGVIFFGSHRTGASPGPWSAYDFFVVTSSYLDLYRCLRAAGAVSRSPWLLSALNALLPPNQLAFRDPELEGEEPRLAKCAVISTAALERESSGRHRDHFCCGRLFQPAEVLLARDDETRERLLGCLAGALEQSHAWVRPWLPERFEADAYGRCLLRVSLSGEVRPEPGGRSEALWEAQREELGPALGELLRGLAASGELTESSPGVYSLSRPAGVWERLRLRAYFFWSKLRATLRWFKYTVTFEDWLDYIVRKVERHTGQRVCLSERERRWPLLLLWPRVVRFLRSRNR